MCHSTGEPGNPPTSITRASPATARAATTAPPPRARATPYPHQPGLRRVPLPGGLEARQLQPTGITGNCQSCHNGSTAQGKGNNHLVTSQDCAVCHATTAWTPTFDHAGITGNCQSCHNGTTAQGKGNNPHHPGLRRVPLQGGLEARQLQSRGHHRQLPELPQRHHRPGQGQQPYPHQPGLRRVPFHGGLEARQLQSRGRHRQLPELPQRHHRPGQGQ